MVTTPPGLSRILQALHEVVGPGHLGEHVGPADQVGLLALRRQLARRPLAEERDQGRDALLDGHLRHVGRRLDAEDGDALLHEVLQQVAVVARDLDHEAVLPEAEPLRDHVRVAAHVLDPAVGVRGEVGVLGEDRLRADVLLELHQEALARRRRRGADRTAPSG